MKKVLMIVALVLMILIGMVIAADAETNRSDSLQNLFQEFFPDYSCEDGYLQDDGTVIFITAPNLKAWGRLSDSLHGRNTI